MRSVGDVRGGHDRRGQDFKVSNSVKDISVAECGDIWTSGQTGSVAFPRAATQLLFRLL